MKLTFHVCIINNCNYQANRRTVAMILTRAKLIPLKPPVETGENPVDTTGNTDNYKTFKFIKLRK
ncbi:MAG: hypothetical protein ABSB89_00165 [Candidatus Bathyarchaeia archaeon]|jgi:hypothetical protein